MASRGGRSSSADGVPSRGRPKKLAGAAIDLAGPAETVAAGVRLGELLPAGAKVLLEGPLGAGKTTFVKGVVLGRGIATDVTSPTFTLIHEYRGAAETVHHVDLYRIDDPAELLEIGFLDLWDGPETVLVEWADKLPRPLHRLGTVQVTLLPSDGGRLLRVVWRRRPAGVTSAR